MSEKFTWDRVKMKLSAINNNIDIGLVAPLPRKLLCLFGLLGCAYIIIVFIVEDSLNPLWGFLFIGVGFFPIFFYTRSKRRYYTPLIFTIFYFFGYQLSLPQILLNKNGIPRSGFGTIGNFVFTDSNFFVVMFVIIAGMAGILTATLILEKIFKRRQYIVVGKSIAAHFLPKKQLNVWIWLWFCFSACLILLMWYLEIGRTGLEGKTRLPFKLAGFFVYLRGIFIPFCGILLLDICLRGEWKRLSSLILQMLIVVGVLSSLGATSRGAFVFTVFPAIAYLFFTYRKNNLSKRLFMKFSIIGLAIGAGIIAIVQISRNVSYLTTSWSLSDALNLLKNLKIINFDFSDIIKTFFVLLIGRFGGIREIMAVIASNVSGIEIPFNMFMGTIDTGTSQFISNSVMGFVPRTTGGLAFGISYGMWGQLYLSKSYLIVYLGTALLVGITICVEEIFIRKGFSSVALLISILLGFQFWGSASIFQLSRFIILSLVCYLTMLYILKKIKKWLFVVSM
jgi:hypothetical protein